MSTIYELTAEFQELLLWAEDEDIDPKTLADTFEGIDYEFEAKCDAYAKIITQLNADAEAIKKEVDRLRIKEENLKNNAKRMKETLQYAMQVTGKTKFKTTLFSFSIQKNPSALKIDDATKIPAQYLIPQEPKVDNASIKQALKEGADYDWCHLEQSKGLRIR